MPDGYTRLRQGEKRPILGQISAGIGTVTVLTTPTPTSALFDSLGVGVPGFSGLTVAGFDPGALTNPRLWTNLDTTGLAAGFYTLVFTVTTNASDGTTRRFTPTVEIELLAVGK
ncbi:MAG: hypothetical protein H7308_11750 [Chthonomonadaceae bacterium]|nr:hypothetical protein [Chthonomonadaceae bacterium]